MHINVLNKMTPNRKFSLNSYALEHFRVKLSEYFKRYAYNK